MAINFDPKWKLGCIFSETVNLSRLYIFIFHFSYKCTLIHVQYLPLAYRICRIEGKVGKMPANKHICHASGIYREIMENNGKYWQI